MEAINSEQYKRLKQIFQGALELSGDVSLYLDTECAGDAGLRLQVEALLESHSGAGDFLEEPILPTALAEALPEIERAEGKRIGPYRVVREIGRGGMGTVYAAERCDGQYEKTVAIKLVTRGMDTDSVLARFRIERQILANLDHPNIARLLDGGITDDGRPYIVMEYIEGIPIDEYCDRHSLSIDDRLKLFAVVCSAMQHAHEKHVIHRDIKPGNVLVNDAGIPKLLDFGIGKRLGPDPSTSPTRITVVHPMTPDFASPEQIRGADITPSSDIYSLGLLMYILLTGRHPFAGSGDLVSRLGGSASEIDLPSRAVAVREDSRSTTRRLAGDLDNIVMMCLREDPDRRYGTVRDVADDIGRHLETRPVRARRETLGYRTTKYVQRNQSHLKIAAFSVLACMIVALGLFTTLRLFTRIPFERRDWLIVADFDNLTGEDIFDRSLNTALSSSLEQSAHLNVFPRRSIEGSLRRIKAPIGPRVDAATALQVANRESLKLVVVSIRPDEFGYTVSAAILDPKSGRQLRSETVQAAGRERVLKALDEVARRIRNDLGEAGSEMGKQQARPVGEVFTASLQALKLFSLATENVRAARFKEGRDLYQQALAIDPKFTAATGALGMVEFEIFDKDRGRQLLSQALQQIDGLTITEQYNTRAFYAAAVQNDLPKAEQMWKELIAIYPDASHAHNNLGRVYLFMGRWEDAAASFRRAIEIDPYLGVSYDNLAWIYETKLGDLDSAIALCRQEISYDDQNFLPYAYLGWAYLGKGDLEQARAVLERSIQLNNKNSAALSSLGQVYRLQRRYPDAVRRFLDIMAADKTEISANYLAGLTYESSGDPVQARQHFEEFRADAAKRLADMPTNLQAHLDMAKALVHLHAVPAARNMLQKALALGPGTDPSDTQFQIALVFSMLGDTQEALSRLDQAVHGGFRDYTRLRIDPDLTVLQDQPAFLRILDSVPTRER